MIQYCVPITALNLCLLCPLYMWIYHNPQLHKGHMQLLRVVQVRCLHSLGIHLFSSPQVGTQSISKESHVKALHGSLKAWTSLSALSHFRETVAVTTPQDRNAGQAPELLACLLEVLGLVPSPARKNFFFFFFLHCKMKK